MSIFNWLNWVPAISTTALFGIAVYFLKPLAERMFFGSIDYRFNKKIEKIRNDFYIKQTEINDEMKRSEIQLEELKRSAFSGLNERQKLLFRRMLESVDQIWSSVHMLGHIKMATEMMKAIDVSKLTDSDLKQPDIKTFFQTIAKSINEDKIKDDESWRAEPYVPETVWAYFSVYQMILLHAFVHIKMLEIGFSPEKFLKNDELTNKAKTAFPEYTESFDKYGYTFSYFIIDQIKSRLLNEIKQFLSGEGAEKASVERAAKIQTLARAMQENKEEATKNLAT